MEYLAINDLRQRDGLRLVLVKGVPSPWGQAAKAMMEYKGLAYCAGLQIPAGENRDLVAWTGTNSGPVVAWNDEKPIDRWLDILNLLERLAPEPALLPAVRSDRAVAVGLANEICGELGLGWNRRLSLYRPALASDMPPQRAITMGAKYGFTEAAAIAAVGHQIAALEMLAQRLEAQRTAGSEFFVGNSPTAVDFYWAAFSNIFVLPDEKVVPVDPVRRPMFEAIEPEIRAAIVPILLEQRERMMARYFKRPMEF